MMQPEQAHTLALASATMATLMLMSCFMWVRDLKRRVHYQDAPHWHRGMAPAWICGALGALAIIATAWITLSSPELIPSPKAGQSQLIIAAASLVRSLACSALCTHESPQEPALQRGHRWKARPAH